MPQVVRRLQQHQAPAIESRNNDDYGPLYASKGVKGSDDQGEDDDGDEDAAGGERKRARLADPDVINVLLQAADINAEAAAMLADSDDANDHLEADDASIPACE